MTTMDSDSTQLLTATEWHSGADLAQREPCPHCQRQIEVGEEFCTSCGYQRGTWGNSGVTGTLKGSMPLPAAGAPTRFTLRAADGERFALPEGETIAGRGDVSLRLDDSFVSRQHLRFTVEGDAVTIADLGSSNGSFLDGRRLEPNVPEVLAPGQQLKLGQREFSLEQNVAAPVEAAPPADADDATQVVTTPPQQGMEPTVEAAADDASDDAGPLSPWTLVVQTDGTRHALPLGLTTIGRKAELSDLVLMGDGYLSGKHCLMDAAADALTVTDLGSTNGSFVNDERLAAQEPRALHEGDVVKLGQTELRVALTNAEDGATVDEQSETPAGEAH